MEQVNEGEQQQREQLEMRHQQHLTEIRERSQAMRQLDHDISDVTQIMKDLARIVHDQGEFVDSIEANVEHSTIQVHQGAIDVHRAVVYQQKARQKKLILLAFFITLIVILILVAYFFSNVHGLHWQQRLKEWLGNGPFVYGSRISSVDATCPKQAACTVEKMERRFGLSWSKLRVGLSWSQLGEAITKKKSAMIVVL
ncbi:unnamed protein product [Gongylonema pulchrum]|uniref:t-SNARE coiled-coil homology domain-containing protein n=1 Tax=Gongylonema pulchrum TaxID=637853 RepID=A0A183DQ62_9BILA|nr:unnamed protein product [Gongylonema pulchrum]